MLRKQETSLGRGAWVESSGGKGTQEDCSVVWLTVSGFTVMWLVSRLSLANHSDSGSFMVACASFSQDRSKSEGLWEVGRTCGLESPFDFPQVFGLMAAC